MGNNPKIDGSILPFPPKPSGSKAGTTMQESTYSPLPEPQRFPDDAPHILVVLINDAGPALPECLGSDPYTPTLQNVKEGGVGNGQICEFANDWVDYSGRIPESCALQADVLRNYDYSTGAWG